MDNNKNNIEEIKSMQISGAGSLPLLVMGAGLALFDTDEPIRFPGMSKEMKLPKGRTTKVTMGYSNCQLYGNGKIIVGKENPKEYSNDPNSFI